MPRYTWTNFLWIFALSLQLTCSLLLVRTKIPRWSTHSSKLVIHGQLGLSQSVRLLDLQPGNMHLKSTINMELLTIELRKLQLVRRYDSNAESGLCYGKRWAPIKMSCCGPPKIQDSLYSHHTDWLYCSYFCHGYWSWFSSGNDVYRNAFGLYFGGCIYSHSQVHLKESKEFYIFNSKFCQVWMEPFKTQYYEFRRCITLATWTYGRVFKKIQTYHLHSM